MPAASAVHPVIESVGNECIRTSQSTSPPGAGAVSIGRAYVAVALIRSGMLWASAFVAKRKLAPARPE